VPHNRGVRTLGALALVYVDAQVVALREGEARLRAGGSDVHELRVAVRRLRSTLRTYADLFDTDRGRALAGELRWYAGVLGSVRDAEVLRSHFDAAVAQLPLGLVIGPVAQRIDDELAAQHETGLNELCAELNAPRYTALRAEVDRWANGPPVTSVGRRRAADVASYVQLERKRLRKRLRVIGAGEADDAAVHAARKTAKRCRYAVELAAPALEREPVQRLVRRMQHVQDDLGEFQDAVVAASALLHIRGNAEAAGEDGFTYGLLYAREQHRGQLARQRVRHRSL
jgi:CHAD domain-containing protein